MKHLSCLFLVLIVSTSLFSQRTIEQGKQWNIYDGKFFSPNSCTDLYSFRNDTLINSVEYLELFVKRDTVGSASWTSQRKFLREDSLNRIYVLGSGEEQILYDFNLIVGDTFQTFCDLIVVQVDSVPLFNGDLRKRIRLVSSNDPNPDQPYGGFKDWIQGIGSTTSLTEYPYSCYTDYSLDLLCFYENDAIQYAEHNGLGCYLAPVNELDTRRAIQIYPNPAKERITIESESEVLETKIYSLSGELVLASIQNTVGVNSIPKGLYIVQVETREGLQSKKLIVQ